MNDSVQESRPSDRPGCGPEPSFSRKLAIPAGYPSLEVAFREEGEVSLLDWQGFIPPALKLEGISANYPPHPQAKAWGPKEITHLVAVVELGPTSQLFQTTRSPTPTLPLPLWPASLGMAYTLLSSFNEFTFALDPWPSLPSTVAFSVVNRMGFSVHIPAPLPNS